MENSYKLQNYTEILVEDAIKNIWRESDAICKCQRCYYDTMALSLNHLPSMHIAFP